MGNLRPSEDRLADDISSNFSTIISTVLADGLSYNQYQWFWPVMTTRDAQHAARNSLLRIQSASTELGISAERMKVNARFPVRVGIDVSQYGWGTRMPDLALKSSTTVMDVYLAVVFPCFSFALVDYCCWYRYTNRIWDTLQELTVLIFRSEQPKTKLDGARVRIG